MTAFGGTSSSATGGNEQRFASRQWQVIYAVAFCGATSFPLALLAIAVGLPWNVLLAAGAAVSLVYGLAQAFRIALIVNADQITVRNFGRSYRIVWPEVSAIELREEIALGNVRSRLVTFVRRPPKEPVEAYATLSRKVRREALRALQPLATEVGVTFDIPKDVYE
jgi:hypothetical protein